MKKDENTSTKRRDAEALGRRLLLARVAGDVAAGIVSSPSESSASADGVATIAVDIAEAILQKAGL